MPVSQSLSPVPFHGDTIFVVDHQGEPLAPVRPIVENIGLEWSAQRQKLTANRPRWGVSMIDTPSAGGLQKTLCIPVRKLAGFLATINPAKVRNDLRAKIICYQNECDDALWNYWTKGEAKRPASSTQPHQPNLPLDEKVDDVVTLQAKYIKLLESHVSLLENKTVSSKVIGATPRRKNRSYTQVTVTEADQMRKLFANGLSRYQIAKIFNRGRTTISKFVGGINE
ncbi:MAG TPA: phage antirepressor N-terminal domain-containing protein [Candidatus Rifleibacterium sp.]|nr:phage antirepressor N-terminal domain-containing protein [Candidatus Rifleibacterium sp.]HPT45055.1 phage antirepressor N-terminal domain-containing protein [Candidatus Rifleibacterium sp.]